MDKQSSELNQLSRVLFDKAASYWQLSIALSFVSGATGVEVSLAETTLAANAYFAAIAAIILCVSYYLRFRFESVHDAAETMRRQSVLSEGLGWSIPRSQFNEWRQLAGGKVLKAVAANPRPDGYYETKENLGAKRLAEMTFESLFWTKSLYRKIQSYLLSTIVIAALLLLGVVLFLPLFDLDAADRIWLAYFVYLAIPVLITIDMIGMYIRLRRSVSALVAIEPNIEHLANEASPDEAQVLRLVSEYNCILAAGLPIPKWVFSRHYDEIQACWK